MTDIVIIGGGHNALVAAFYLAKAGLKPVVCERRDEVGGGAVTEEIHPGFRCPTLSHEILLHQRIVRDLELPRHGLELLTPAVEVCSLSTSSAPLVLYDDPERTAESLQRTSSKDAAAYPAYRAAIRGIASILASVFESPPPDIDH